MLLTHLKTFFSDLLHWSRQDENRNLATGIGVACNIANALILILVAVYANSANRRNVVQANLIQQQKVDTDHAMLVVNEEIKKSHAEHLKLIDRMIQISERGTDLQAQNVAILRKLENSPEIDLASRSYKRLIVALNKLSWTPHEAGDDLSRYRMLETKRVRQIVLSMDDLDWLLNLVKRIDPMTSKLFDSLGKDKEAEVTQELATELQIDNEGLLFPAISYCYGTRSDNEMSFRNFARLYTRLQSAGDSKLDCSLIEKLFEGNNPSIDEVGRMYLSCLSNPKLKQELSNILRSDPTRLSDQKTAVMLRRQLHEYILEVGANERLRLQRFRDVSVVDVVTSKPANQ